ncbi:MAG: transposase [Candidatus Hodarchaeales archaeon]
MSYEKGDTFHLGLLNHRDELLEVLGAVNGLLDLYDKVYFNTTLFVTEFMKKMWLNENRECPKCNSFRGYYTINVSGRNSHYFKCKKCYFKFSLNYGTIFHDSKLTNHQIFHLLYLLVFSEKRISDAEIGRRIGVTQKTAWKVINKIEKQLQ